MSLVLVTEQHLMDTADSIRNKLGVQTTYKPREFAAAIDSIQTGGGGSSTSFYTGTYTPSENTTGPSFDIGGNFTHFVIWATENTGGKGVKAFRLAICDFSATPTMLYGIATNNSGSTVAGLTFGATWFSKSGNTVTCSNKGTSGANNAGYWIGGITYQWVAW